MSLDLDVVERGVINPGFSLGKEFTSASLNVGTPGPQPLAPTMQMAEGRFTSDGRKIWTPLDSAHNAGVLGMKPTPENIQLGIDNVNAMKDPNRGYVKGTVKLNGM